MSVRMIEKKWKWPHENTIQREKLLAVAIMTEIDSWTRCFSNKLDLTGVGDFFVEKPVQPFS